MSDSVSWVALGTSALLLLDKFLTKNKLKKCKCCGACFEFQADTIASPRPVHRVSNDKRENTADEVAIEIVKPVVQT